MLPASCRPLRSAAAPRDALPLPFPPLRARTTTAGGAGLRAPLAGPVKRTDLRRGGCASHQTARAASLNAGRGSAGYTVAPRFPRRSCFGATKAKQPAAFSAKPPANPHIGARFFARFGGRVYDGRMSEIPVIPSSEIARAANGQLRPGSRLNPHGRPLGSGGGFRLALQMVADIANSEKFRAALRKQAEEHPFQYARGSLLPLTPTKHRKALRAQIRAAEQAAFDKAHSSFSGVSETGQP